MFVRSDLQDSENALYCFCFTDYGGGVLYPTESSDSGTRLAIGVGIAAALVVVFLIGTLVYFLRLENVMMGQQFCSKKLRVDLRMKL